MAWNMDAWGPISLIDLGASPTVSRFISFAGVPPMASLYTTGQDADAVSIPNSTVAGSTCHSGLPVKVESGAAFSARATLQSDSTGPATTRMTGVAIGGRRRLRPGRVRLRGWCS